MELFDTLHYWHWWVIAIVLVILELTVSGAFFFLWLAADAREQGGVAAECDTGAGYRCLMVRSRYDRIELAALARLDRSGRSSDGTRAGLGVHFAEPGSAAWQFASGPQLEPRQ